MTSSWASLFGTHVNIYRILLRADGLVRLAGELSFLMLHAARERAKWPNVDKWFLSPSKRPERFALADTTAGD